MAVVTSYVTVKAVLADGESYSAPSTGYPLITTVIYPGEPGTFVRMDLYDFDAGLAPSDQDFDFLDGDPFEFLDGDPFNFL